MGNTSLSLFQGRNVCPEKGQLRREQLYVWSRSGKSVPLSLFYTLIAGSAELRGGCAQSRCASPPIVSGTGSWPCAAELYNLCSAFYIILLDEQENIRCGSQGGLQEQLCSLSPCFPLGTERAQLCSLPVFVSGHGHWRTAP